MTIQAAQKQAIEEIINVLVNTSPPRGKRHLSAMFMDLVDRSEYPEYYEVIPEPRCLNDIRASVEKGRYKDALSAYTDLSLVFWNAMFYNEPDSQIAMDASTLKGVLESEWQKHSVLPSDIRASPPPSSAQKVHAKPPATLPPAPTPAKRTSTPRVSTPKGTPAPPPSIQTTFPAANPQTQSVASSSRPLPASSRTRTPMSEMEVDGDESMDADVEIDVVDHEANARQNRGGSAMPVAPYAAGSGQQEGAGVGMGMERDDDSDEIVRALEKSLPRWGGYEDVGWMSEVSHERHVEIIHVIKSYKDIVGNRLATALEAVGEETIINNVSYTAPLSLKLIESNVRAKKFGSSQEFDKSMIRLFEKARRWHEPCSEPYGRVLLLQRLYQALTSSNPPPGPPYSSPTNFASLRAGPGTARPVHATHTADPEGGVPGVTTFRVSNKDRTFVDEVHYKGWSVRLGDWLHLSNPDDPSRPIVAQVFKCWVSDEIAKKGQPGLTMCWYFRPEQTFHPVERQFWEGEVFKTSHFADHPLDDIIEKIACQFTARHIRGRPRPPFWYPGWPLYVCDSRYNDRERVFVRIKNWNSCVPEEVRKSDEFMPIFPFERTVFPRRYGSPFVVQNPKIGPVKGPGGIGHAVERVEGENVDSGRKRPRRTAGGDGPSKGVFVGSGTPGAGTVPAPVYQQQQPQYQHRSPGHVEDRSIINAAGGMAVLGGQVHVEKLPSETARHFDRDPETNEVLWFASPPLNVAHAPTPKYSLAYLHFLAKKRKAELEGVDTGKRPKVQPSPTMTEISRRVLANASES
ncbi:hypothetical protein HWV62_21208 [Athelia sp. TMB]|nr:hypothetical protein HWV62_21208 [Athelia sp. TMB]